MELTEVVFDNLVGDTDGLVVLDVIMDGLLDTLLRSSEQFYSSLSIFMSQRMNSHAPKSRLELGLLDVPVGVDSKDAGVTGTEGVEYRMLKSNRHLQKWVVVQTIYM